MGWNFPMTVYAVGFASLLISLYGEQGGDLRCWLYQIAELESNMCRRAFGREFTGSEAAD